MRVALLADIHGNLVSFEAVLNDLSRDPPDCVICLGDVAASGPQPAEILDRLQELGWPVLMGNADEWFLIDRLRRPHG